MQGREEIRDSHTGSQGQMDPLAVSAKSMRIYQLGEEMGLSAKDVLAKVRALGVAANNHMSQLTADDVVRLRRAIEKERQQGQLVETIAPTVMRRRTKAAPPPPPPAPKAAAPAAAPVEQRERDRERDRALDRLAAAAPASGRSQPSQITPPPAAAPSETTGQPLAAEGAHVPQLSPSGQPMGTGQPTLPGQAPTTPRFIDISSRIVPRVEITELARRRGDTVRRDLVSERERMKQQSKIKKKRLLPPGKKGKQTEITTPAEHKRVVRMAETIALSELAHRMGVKATEVLKKLWSMGMTGVNINQNVDTETAQIVAGEFGYEVVSETFREEQVLGGEVDKPEDLEPRAPVVTVMGHVDHGKTSLLDAIREANVAAGEAGGITQHVAAYKVTTKTGNEVVFIDTPGHEAFTAMRARGAQVTDIVVLVVAADDGPMPQTIEAIEHAKAAKVPIVVAMNKIDKPEANAEKVRNQLAERGLVPEQWGGDTIYVEVSARTKVGVDKLVEMLAVQTEVMELRANHKKPARGIVLEAKLDRARGPMATVIIQEGTLKPGDTIVTGEHIGKLRAMLDDRGRQLSQAGPSTPVELLGLGGVPEAGDTLAVVSDERAAKELIEHRRATRRQKDLAQSARVSMESLMERIQEGQAQELRVVLKADVQGSAEAVQNALERIASDAVKVVVLSAGVGGITETDVNLAKASGAIILGFHVRPTGKVAQMAEQEGVQIKLYDIIYEALDDVRKAAAGLLAPERREKSLGRADILEVFHITKVGAIAGCRVTDGKITRSSQVRLIRDSVKIYEGKLSSLRRFKDDVREVDKGYECGMSIEGYQDIKPGDVIEAFEIEEIAAIL